jgi:hypothetical protein
MPSDRVLPGERLMGALLVSGVLSQPGADAVWAKKAHVAVLSIRNAARGKAISRCEWERLEHVTRHPSEELPANCGGLPVLKHGGAR